MGLLEFVGVEEGEFVRVVKRFVAVVRAGGRTLECHIHDTGRLDHLLWPGVRVYFRRVSGLGRRTGCDLVASEAGRLTLIDSRIPNKVFPSIARLVYGRECSIVGEQGFMGARFDFIVSCGGVVELVEVKGVNLVVDGAGLFPNAPSRRALKQLDILATASRHGAIGALVFVVLRDDAEIVAPNRRVDPEFARRLCAYRDKLKYQAFKLVPRVSGDRIVVEGFREVRVEPC